MSLRPRQLFCIRPKPIRETNNLPINFRRIGDGPLHAAAGKRNAGGSSMSLRPRQLFCIRPKPIRETNNLPINFRRIGDGPLHAAAGKRNAGGTCSCLPAFRFPDSRLLRGLRFLDRWLAELAFDHGDLLDVRLVRCRARCRRALALRTGELRHEVAGLLQ